MWPTSVIFNQTAQIEQSASRRKFAQSGHPAREEMDSFGWARSPQFGAGNKMILEGGIGKRAFYGNTGLRLIGGKKM
jgi:hypothetical protein